MADKVDKDKIFRKVALDRLSSPEELDTLMKVTRPRSWMGIIAIGTLLLTIVIWGVIGTVPTKVQAQGILIKAGGVFDVFAPAAGPIAEVLVVEGETVDRGQLVARIVQPDLVTRIDNEKQGLEELRAQHTELAAFTRTDLSLQTQSLLLQRATLEEAVAFAEQRKSALEEQIENEVSLFERGLITNQTVLQTRQAYYLTNDTLERSRNELKRLEVNDLTLKNQKEQQLIRSQLAINEQQRNIRLMEEQLIVFSEVRSPGNGRVLEVKVRDGDLVPRGASMVSLQVSGEGVEGLQAVIYVPPKDGKYVTPEMAVQLSPLSAPREEYGFLEGNVTYVSEFPSTRGGMMKVLANDVLVQSLMTEGAPFAVYADLVVDEDPENLSGFAWSSPKGEQLRVNSGTLCYVTITVLERRPIELVIPYLRRKTGI